MRGHRSVRDQVLVLLVAMVLLVTGVAGVGAVGAASLSEDVDALAQELRPPAYTNIELRKDMSRAQSGARLWTMTRQRPFKQRYRTAARGARAHLEELGTQVADNPALTALVTQQSEAMRSWFAYGDRITARNAARRVRPAAVVAGQRRYDRFVAANDALSAAVDAAVDAREQHARDQARTVIWVLALVSAVGLLVTALVCRSLVRRVSRPLREMERAVERLAAGELGTRVDEAGPRETRRVAVALNVLAEENQRAREMEERIIDQLRLLDRAKDDFVSTVSHELRTPLTSITGYVELFEEGLEGQLAPHQKGMLNVIRRNVARLRNLIEDLLTLSSVEADAFRTSFDLCDLGRLSLAAVHDIAATAQRAGVTVRLDGPEAAVPVYGEAGQLSRAIRNLVGNAVKFSPAGGDVDVRLDELEDTVVVSVIDRGIGIPADELATLGTRFFRASNAVESEIGGTGLGLRIAQTIADNHGGRLDVESEEGQGTTVRLVLPLARPRATGNKPRVREITEG